MLPQRADFVVHARHLSPADVVEVDGVRVTSGAQTILDLAERLRRADRVRGVVRARACAPVLAPKAMSRPESLIRYWLLASDLPDPQPQVPVHDRWGREVAHGNLGYAGWKLLLEYEGSRHATVEKFGSDVDRYSLMAADGLLVLRFAKRHLNRGTVVDRTGRALTSRGWRAAR